MTSTFDLTTGVLDVWPFDWAEPAPPAAADSAQAPAASWHAPWLPPGGRDTVHDASVFAPYADCGPDAITDAKNGMCRPVPGLEKGFEAMRRLQALMDEQAREYGTPRSILAPPMPRSAQADLAIKNLDRYAARARRDAELRQEVTTAQEIYATCRGDHEVTVQEMCKAHESPPGMRGLSYEDCVRAWMYGTPELKREHRAEKGKKGSVATGIDVPIGTGHAGISGEISAGETTTETATHTYAPTEGYDAECRTLEHAYLQGREAERRAGLRGNGGR